jgi:hypothetical protein
MAIMTVTWPVAVFDDDVYPYVLADQLSLEAWAESEETAHDEFTTGFDSDGRPLHLVFAGGEPSLVISGEPDVAAFRSVASDALTRRGSSASVDGLGVAELIGLLHEVS